MNTFSNFYNNLSSNGVFFFWIVVFLFVVLIFLLVLLLNKNKKLQKLVEEEKELPTKGDNISKVEVNNNESFLPVEDNTKEEVLEDINLEIEEKPEIIEKKIELTEEPKVEEKKEIVKPTGPYQRNILKEINARTQTSPIHIDRDEYYSKKEEKNRLERNAYLEEESLSPLVELEDNFEVNRDMEKLVHMMEEEIKPSNIELTDYEKKQEEEAIISYDELLKVKDKIYNITEDEETDEFLDELKSFRLDLQ